MTEYKSSKILAIPGDAGVVSSGTENVVRPCKHQSFPNLVVKCYPLKHNEEGIGNRLEKQTRILQTVDHPNLVKTVGFTKWQSGIGTLMEFERCITLEDLVYSRDCPGLETKLQMISDVIFAVERLHNFSDFTYVTHGSVAPGNVLVTQDVRCKLAGLSLAREWDTRDPNRVGVPPFERGPSVDEAFVAPELRSDPNAVPGKAQDMYAVGKTMLAVLIGRRPSVDSDLVDLPTPDDRKSQLIVNHLKMAVEQCLSDPPELRLSASQLKIQLQSLMNHVGYNRVATCLGGDFDDLCPWPSSLLEGRTLQSLDKCVDETNRTLDLDYYDDVNSCFDESDETNPKLLVAPQAKVHNRNRFSDPNLCEAPALPPDRGFRNRVVPVNPEDHLRIKQREYKTPRKQSFAHDSADYEIEIEYPVEIDRTQPVCDDRQKRYHLTGSHLNHQYEDVELQRRESGAEYHRTWQSESPSSSNPDIHNAQPNCLYEDPSRLPPNSGDQPTCERPRCETDPAPITPPVKPLLRWTKSEPPTQTLSTLVSDGKKPMVPPRPNELRRRNALSKNKPKYRSWEALPKELSYMKKKRDTTAMTPPFANSGTAEKLLKRHSKDLAQGRFAGARKTRKEMWRECVQKSDACSSTNLRLYANGLGEQGAIHEAVLLLLFAFRLCSVAQPPAYRQQEVEKCSGDLLYLVKDLDASHRALVKNYILPSLLEVKREINDGDPLYNFVCSYTVGILEYFSKDHSRAEGTLMQAVVDLEHHLEPQHQYKSKAFGHCKFFQGCLYMAAAEHDNLDHALARKALRSVQDARLTFQTCDTVGDSRVDRELCSLAIEQIDIKQQLVICRRKLKDLSDQYTMSDIAA